MAIGLFTGCRSLLTRDGHTVVVLALPPGSGPYSEIATVVSAMAPTTVAIFVTELREGWQVRGRRGRMTARGPGGCDRWLRPRDGRSSRPRRPALSGSCHCRLRG